MHLKLSLRLFRTLAIIIPTLFLWGCLGEGSGPEPIAGTPAPSLTGVLIDAPVSGASWQASSGLSGITNAAGEFQYRQGDQVTFSIGGIVLGTTEGKPYITVVELTNSIDPTSTAATNMLIFLQSIDSDGDPTNGITISAATRTAAAGRTLNFSAADFDSQVAAVVAAIAPGNSVISASDALFNFYQAYAELGGTDTFDFGFPGFPPVGGGVSYELVFADEFNTGTSPNPANWTIETGYGPNNAGWGNNEWQLYTNSPNNVRVENGNLVLEAQCLTPPCLGVRDGNITSGKINSLNKFNFKFGKVFAKIKPPVGKGTWPAFWSLGVNHDTVGWPRSGEIDFLEMHNFYSDANTTHFTMHWCDETIAPAPPADCFPQENGWKFFTQNRTFPTSLGDDYHIFEADWDGNRIIGKIDGITYFTKTIEAATMEEFLREFYLILNVAMGGTLGSGEQPPDGTETFPQTMLVDYVRVYQLVGGGETGDALVDFEADPASYNFGPDGGFAGGASSVIANPNQSGINTTAQVAQMLKFPGEVFGGSTLSLGSNLNFSQGGVFKMKVLATRSVPVLFKLEDAISGLPENGLERSISHSGSGTWEELCFDFTGATGNFTSNSITFIFDVTVNGDAINNPNDWTFYYDEIVQTDSCAGGGGGGGGGGAGAGIIPDAVIYATDPGVTVDLPPPAFDTFGSGAVFDGFYALDPDFNPAFAVTSGTNFGGQHVGFVAFNGYAAGFAAGYESLNFKVKGLPANTIEVKFINGGDTSIVYDVTTYAGSAPLGNGWYQVTIPISDFAATIAANSGLLLGPLGDQGAAFTFLLTDIGFSGTAGGGGGAGAGIIPDAVIYATDPGVTVDLPPPAFDTFGSGAVFDGFYALDPDFNPAFAVTSGTNFGGQHVGFVAFNGYAAGFAAGYESLNFKVKGLPANTIEVKFINGGDTSIVYDVTTYAGSAPLGNGWYQVTIPISDFAATIAANSGLLLGPLGDQGAAFTFLLTDIGFSGTAGGGGGAGAGIIPDAVIYATDPGVTVDLPPPAFDTFGSGAVFDGFYALDPDFNPAFAVTSGTNFGGQHVGFVAFNGYAAGFAAGYESLNFKVKGLPANTIEVKFINGGDTSIVYDVTTYAGSAPLGNGWYQVTIPISDFAATIAANSGLLLGPLGDQGAAFTFLLTDIGFSGTAGGGGGAGAGIIPDAVIYATDPGVTVDLPPPAFDTFGSGAVFDGFYALDPDFNPAFAVTSGTNFGGQHVGFVAFNGYAAGFAAGYESLNFKVKGLPANTIEVKFINGGDTSIVYDVTTYAGSAPLGNGWYQVTIPISDFAATIAANSGLLLGPLGDQGAAFTFLLTDIGFSGTAGGGGGAAGELTTNGDFETGSLGGWDVFPGGGTITAVNTENNTPGGMWSAHAVAGPGNNPVLKQSFLAAGTVMPGDTINISFDMKGSAAAGGVVFPKLIDEQSGGGAAGQLLDTIAVPTAGWTTYTYSPMAGADVGGGVTFEIAVVCGADAACSNNVFIDNVTVTINGGGSGGGGGAGAGIIPDAVIYATDPGVTVDLPPPAFDTFGSGAVFDGFYALDPDFNPAFAVTSGTNFGGQHVGFVAFNGYAAGFAAGYESLNFKVKGLPANTIEVKFINGGDTSIVYDVTTYAGSAPLGNGWYQVTIPISDFAATIAANSGLLLGPLGDQGAAFTFLLTDIGFSGTAGGGGGNGIIPDAVIYATDPGVTVDLPPPAFDTFGSGAVFDGFYALDPDFNPAFAVTSGTNFGGQHVGFVAFNGYAAGFAAGYESLNFKVKGLPANTIEVKFINGGDTSIVYDVTTYAGSAPLGNGWYQVTIPISDFAATIAANSGLLLGPLGDQGAAFTFLLTDIGFSGTAGGGGGAAGELTTNGDFETGSLGGWDVFPGGGTITAVNTENNTPGGMWSAHAVAGPGNNPVLKQSFLAAGTVMPGDTINISFDMKGSAAAGGVVFPKLIDEQSGGGAAGQLLDTIAVPTAGWTTYTYSPMAGADVGGGVTFEIAVVCGADAACSNNVFIDNVTVTINGGGG